MRVKVEIENVEKVTDELERLLCWWSGYRMGLMTKDGSVPQELSDADAGIQTLKEIKANIQEEVKRSLKS